MSTKLGSIEKAILEYKRLHPNRVMTVGLVEYAIFPEFKKHEFTAHHYLQNLVIAGYLSKGPSRGGYEMTSKYTAELKEKATKKTKKEEATRSEKSETESISSDETPEKDENKGTSKEAE